MNEEATVLPAEVIAEVIELKQEVANLKAWATRATELIQNTQESDGCEYMWLP